MERPSLEVRGKLSWAKLWHAAERMLKDLIEVSRSYTTGQAPAPQIESQYK